MKRTDLFIPIKRDTTKTDSINAALLTKAGFINQTSAGVYNFLPLAVRAIANIEQVVREEMNRLGASEVVFSALQPQQTWEKSGRWDDPNFRQIIYFDPEAKMTFGATHEEPMAQVIKESVQSYRDLPVLLYQFQTKFRRELRAKSGLLRGREFRMKDLYSFHPDIKTHQHFYEEVATAYLRIFERVGLTAYRVKAAGGVFSQEFSDEFQVECPTGEDEILIDRANKTGFNQEVEGQISAADQKKLERVRAIEVGNIFHLGSKYTDAFEVMYLDRNGARQSITMGSYGLGISRLLGTLAEIYHDENGLKLPAVIAPFDMVVIDLTETKMGQKLLAQFEKQGYRVMLDDREEAPGVKFIEADLVGYPFRLVYSHKTAQEGMIEVKTRSTGNIKTLPVDELSAFLEKNLS